MVWLWLGIASLRSMSVLPDCQACTVAVIGLGYVGLPLAVAFALSACVRLASL